MGFVIVAIVAVVLLIPLVYELPNYVYNRKYAILHFLRWNTAFYIILFFTMLCALTIDGLLMINRTSTLSVFSVRLWIGIVIGAVSIFYFIRLIPVYYDEQFDVKAPTRLTGTFVRETVAITVFITALFLVSVYWWSFIIDAAIALFLYLSRLRRHLKARADAKRKADFERRTK